MSLLNVVNVVFKKSRQMLTIARDSMRGNPYENGSSKFCSGLRSFLMNAETLKHVNTNICCFLAIFNKCLKEDSWINV
jgi:hypothetical protein